MAQKSSRSTLTTDKTTLCEPPFESGQEPIQHCSYTPAADSLWLDFSVTDLNAIHHHLWMVGSIGNINTLHHQRVLLRDIIPSECSRLHLVWFDRTIYVKPLPEYLLNLKFYRDVVCNDVELYGLIVGFLRSYCYLIQFPVDLAIAQEIYLVPKDVTWHQWASFRQAVLIRTEASDVNKRFIYGELRLHRLDLIYRFTGRGLIYFTVHRAYETYFREYFTIFATAFGFLAVILTAMQVLVAINPIPKALVTVCFRFSIAVLVLTCVCFGYIGLIFLSLFLYNYIVTLFANG
ncbi:hypothetical protein MMC29_004864 [Sticta canariensis]|nr:hypothetical protein [Sticta canariensis]